MRMSWSPTVWCDGQLAPLDAVAIPALSIGTIYGVGLFETVRAYCGRPFALNRHLDRLAASAAELSLACPWLSDRSGLAHAVAAVLMANGLRDAAVRITLIAEGPSLDEPAPTLVIAARRFDGYPSRWYTDGISLATAPWRRCPQDLHVTLKSANYLTCLYARHWAIARGADEALLLNCHGRVAEGAVSNVFAVDAVGRVVTPPVSEGLLAGVTRAIVMEILADLGIPAAERPLLPEALLSASEAFITNSLMEVVPVREIDGVTLAECPGPLTERVAAAYRALTKR